MSSILTYPSPLSFFVKYFNNVIIIVIFVIFIINILWVLSDTTQIMVQYVPIPIMGTVFVGMGMVWVGFRMGNPWVGFSHTAPVPINKQQPALCMYSALSN